MVAVHDAINHVFVFHEAEPFFHGWIVFTDGLVVTESGVNHVGHGDERAWPCHAVGVVAPIRRKHVADAAVFELAVFAVDEPLGVKAMIIKDIALAEAACGTVAGPAHALVTLRTVGGHGAVVASDAPVGVAVDGVENLVGGLEGAGGGHFVIEDEATEICRVRGFSENAEISETLDCDVAKTMVREHRVPM